MIEGFSGCWDWVSLSSNRALPWSVALVERYAESWDWDGLSMNRGLPWSEALIEKFAPKWTARGLSFNEALPWTPRLIECFKDRWHWVLLSQSKALPWSEILIEQYQDLWDWDELAQNVAIPWSDALIGRYLEHWYWPALSLNKALPWSVELIDRYSERWDWEYLSANESLPWSESLIDRYAERWHWAGSDPESPALSGNPALPWSRDLIERFEDRWNWDWLSDNEALPWCEALLEQYADVWDWTVIEYNALPQILPRWTDSSVRAVMNRILHWSQSGGDSMRDYSTAEAVDQAETDLNHENLAQPAGLDPEMMKDGSYIAGFYIEAGARAFDAYSKAMVDDLGEAVRPFLREWYNSALDILDEAGHDVSDMDDPTGVKRELERLLTKPDQRDTIAPRPGPPRTEVAASLGVPRSELNQESPDHDEPATAAGLDQSVSSWLNTLLDRTPWAINKVSDFDEETYAKAKPHFQAILDDAQTAGRDVRDFIRLVIENFGSGVKPYLLRFALDVRAATAGATSVETPPVTDEKSDESDPEMPVPPTIPEDTGGTTKPEKPKEKVETP